MYKVQADVEKNRLYVWLEGFFEVEEMRKSTDEAIAVSKKLKPGYDVITDISKFKTGSPEVAKEIERAQAHFVASKARRGVRIIGTSVLPGLQFKHKAEDVGYVSVNVATLEEAEKVLVAK